ncbi:iron-sulfur cluster assembly scaffold protein [Patescibacteria group bacterium]|nr:iron-sulfur cluster assembly scaffold protein [Patescibacteria group bacterium]
MQYSKKLLEYFKNPHNQGKIKDADAVGEAGNIKCGDIMKIYIKVKKNQAGEEIIDDIKFETLGCAAAIAASSSLTDLAKGKTLDSAMKITKQDIVEELGGVPLIKQHCSILAQNALKKAIENYLLVSEKAR